MARLVTAQRGDFARPSALADATDPRFTPAESARLAAFDRAPDVPESYAATVERMARAMWEYERPNICGDDDCCTWPSLEAWRLASYRGMAEAALRVVPVDGGAA